MTHANASMPPCQNSGGTEPLKRSAYAASHETATATRSKAKAAAESHEGLIRIVSLCECELSPLAVDAQTHQRQEHVPRHEQNPLTCQRCANGEQRHDTAAQ